MKTRMFLLSCFFLLASLQAQNKRNPDVTGQELISHITYLASDELEGRRAGSKGAEKAAAYIANEFKTYGLVPLGNNHSYLQTFDFVSGVRLGSTNEFTTRSGNGSKALTVNRDFRPLGFSTSGSYSGEVVVVGYGIVAPEQKYDDYAGVDIKEKAVLLLRYNPDGDTPHSQFIQYSSLRYKVSKAKELGAKAVIVVTGPIEDDKDELMRLVFDQNYGDAGVLVVNVTQAAANAMLAGTGLSIRDLQTKIYESKQPKSFTLNGVSVGLTLSVEPIHVQSSNVAGFLEGSDPNLKKEVLVIGAHYDHLGYGGEGSGSLQPDTSAIHNGADDNASGTAGVLELAQAFASHKKELKRSILFISFSGEEEGLLGSAYYVKNPLEPLEQTVAMINMDMIGRLKDNILIVYGTGTSANFEALVGKYNSDSSLVLKMNKDGFGPSDHSSFYGKKIPVYHFFTGTHPDYHKPSDDADKINVAGTEKVVRYVRKVAFDLDTATDKPMYVQVESPRPAGESRGFRVYVGTVPDYSEQTNGMKISSVREGSPAAKGGLLAGDTMIKFGKVDVKNVYDYTYALGEYKPGDVVEVTVKRGTETKTLNVTLERRNQ
jgi:aminopeptidase YwaD